MIHLKRRPGMPNASAIALFAAASKSACAAPSDKSEESNFGVLSGLAAVRLPLASLRKESSTGGRYCNVEG